MLVSWFVGYSCIPSTIPPGPFGARFSTVYLSTKLGKLDLYKKLIKLHAENGEFVRMGSSDLSITNPKAPALIYGPGSKCSKPSWYDLYTQRYPYSQIVTVLHMTKDVVSGVLPLAIKLFGVTNSESSLMSTDSRSRLLPLRAKRLMLAKGSTISHLISWASLRGDPPLTCWKRTSSIGPSGSSMKV